MNPQGERQGERWTAERVLALAPDAASRTAGGKLAAAGPWSGAGARDQGVWGLCAGSGSTPYRTVVDLNGPGYQCSCPSRKFPCKHALGLLLLWASGGGRVPEGGEPPEWAGDWLSERRERAAERAAERAERRADAGPGARGGAGAGAQGESGGANSTADPAAARRRAERRAQRIAAGASELERRLADLLRDGLAAADRAGYGAWEETAARMVDAQAPGLEARVRELAAIPSSGAGWPARLLEECALAHLLDQGFLHIDSLPEKLAATTRARIGVTLPVAELLASAEPVRDRWWVLGRQDSFDGRLTTRRVWIRGERTSRMALLLSFGAGGHSPEPALPAGLRLDADLVYYPSTRPLRAALAERHAPPPAESEPVAVPPGGDVAAALAAYGEALGQDPWLEGWPVVLSGVTPVPGTGDEGWQLADVRTGLALPVDPRCAGRTDLWQLLAIAGGGPITVFGECGHRGFAPITTWDPEPVPLTATTAQGGRR
ncbi:SWIM zinc finger family protein [Streptomyces sp. NA02950]|uniref:SWIM zinc finger family protein n=1 Tax=Streptomyces sp. NA02950 TaxID=2742137 RepID=UPI001590C8B3|nr:SWIM zinc finger family protein [Streptomyces sp. NA02950]QKV94421.1 SWIM zinc finger family protein [Streptomyces sp. NA02950]